MRAFAQGSAVASWSAEFVRWWWSEVTVLVPERVRGAMLGRPVSIRLGREGRLSLAARPDPPPGEPADEVQERAAEEAAVGQLGRQGSVAELVLSEPVCLVRRTSVPAAALRRAGEILALELERITPFRRDDVCFGWRLVEPRGKSPNVQLVQAVVKRELLAVASERLFKAGYTQVRAVYRLPGGSDLDIDVPAGLSRPKSKLLTLLRGAKRVSAVVTVLSAVGIAVLAFANQHKVLAALEEEIGTTQAAAEEVRRTYDAALASGQQIRGLEERRLQTPTIAEMLEEVTRVLPDTAWITDFRMEDGQVTLIGFAELSADLIPAVEGSDLFAEAEFISPVVRAPREGGDRFNIRFQVVGTPALTGGGAQP